MKEADKNIGYIIFTHAGFSCTWCDKAAELLDSVGVSYNLRPLARAELLVKAAEAHMASIPIVYHGDVLVGGYTELTQYLKEKL